MPRTLTATPMVVAGAGGAAFPASTTYPNGAYPTAENIAVRYLTAVQDVATAGVYPGSTELPGSTEYPGRGTQINAQPIVVSTGLVPSSVPFLVTTGIHTLTATGA